MKQVSPNRTNTAGQRGWYSGERSCLPERQTLCDSIYTGSWNSQILTEESGMVLTKTWRERSMGSYCLMDIEVYLEKMEIF